MEKKIPKVKVYHRKSTLPVKKVEIIEIIFCFEKLILEDVYFACLQAECVQGSQLQCFTWSIAIKV